MKHTYTIETMFGDKWNAFIKDCPRSYCEGYMDAMRGQAPGLHLRLMRSDGKVVDEVLANDEVNIGMVAGWPSAGQYERAAEEALRRAASIRENERLQLERSAARRVEQ